MQSNEPLSPALSPFHGEREKLGRRIRLFTWFFIVGLVLSGASAVPLHLEVDWLVKITDAQHLVAAPGSTPPPGWALWLTKVHAALGDVAARHPFLFYGTDWLAFGHFVIALAFVGALRDPIRNRWLFSFGLISCALVVPYAFVLGALRGIPVLWRCIDCSFGVFGAAPMWLCRKWAGELETGQRSVSTHSLGRGKQQILD